MPDAAAATPLSIKLPVAMKRLGLSRPTIDQLLKADVFTIRAPKGRGRGKPLYLLTAEVAVYDATRSEEAVKAYREAQQRGAEHKAQKRGK